MYFVKIHCQHVYTWRNQGGVFSNFAFECCFKDYKWIGLRFFLLLNGLFRRQVYVTQVNLGTTGSRTILDTFQSCITEFRKMMLPILLSSDNRCPSIRKFRDRNSHSMAPARTDVRPVRVGVGWYCYRIMLQNKTGRQQCIWCLSDAINARSVDLNGFFVSHDLVYSASLLFWYQSNYRPIFSYVSSGRRPCTEHSTLNSTRPYPSTASWRRTWRRSSWDSPSLVSTFQSI